MLIEKSNALSSNLICSRCDFPFDHCIFTGIFAPVGSSWPNEADNQFSNVTLSFTILFGSLLIYVNNNTGISIDCAMFSAELPVHLTIAIESSYSNSEKYCIKYNSSSVISIVLFL